VLAVAPDSVDPLSDAEIGGAGPELGDLAHLLVSPADQRVARAVGGRGGEQAAIGVPALDEVRVGPAIRGELGAGADAGVERADEHLAGAGGGDLLVGERDAARSFEDEHLSHGARTVARRERGSIS
jgi:hypothetical protein